MGAIIIALCVLPFVIMGILSKNNKKQRLQYFKNSASTQNCNITLHEILGDIIIGMDENSNSIFFMKKSKENEFSQLISLSEFQSCRVINFGRAANNSTIVEKLELCFYPKSKNSNQQLLTFFDSEEDGLLLTGELQLIEKWEEIVNSSLKSKK